MKLIPFVLIFGLAFPAVRSKASESPANPTTAIETEFLMTMFAPLTPMKPIHQLRILNATPEGGWVEGPRIKGKVVAPAADWSRARPDGTVRVDVRATIAADDGNLIYVSYNGVFRASPDAFDRLEKGETLAGADFYLVIAPTFETESAKYSWLNGVQAVGRMVFLKGGADGYVKYEVFAVK